MVVAELICFADREGSRTGGDVAGELLAARFAEQVLLQRRIAVDSERDLFAADQEFQRE